MLRETRSLYLSICVSLKGDIAWHIVEKQPSLELEQTHTHRSSPGQREISYSEVHSPPTISLSLSVLKLHEFALGLLLLRSKLFL